MEELPPGLLSRLLGVKHDVAPQRFLGSRDFVRCRLQIERFTDGTRRLTHVTEIAGQSFTFNANGSNFGQFFVSFDSFDHRRALSSVGWA